MKLCHLLPCLSRGTAAGARAQFYWIGGQSFRLARSGRFVRKQKKLCNIDAVERMAILRTTGHAVEYLVVVVVSAWLLSALITRTTSRGRQSNFHPSGRSCFDGQFPGCLQCRSVRPVGGRPSRYLKNYARGMWTRPPQWWPRGRCSLGRCSAKSWWPIRRYFVTDRGTSHHYSSLLPSRLARALAWETSFPALHLPLSPSWRLRLRLETWTNFHETRTT